MHQSGRSGFVFSFKIHSTLFIRQANLSTQEPIKISFGGNKQYTLDEHGYLDLPEQWDETFAEGMAGRLGLYGGLTPEHWQFIRYLRGKFIENKTVPFVVHACANNNITLSRLTFLFPTGYHRGACKIAGISYQFMVDSNPWLTQESYSVLKSEYRVSEMAFLESFEQWDERFAEIVASEWKLPEGLTEKHWQMIQYLREHFSRTGTIPTVYAFCKANGIEVKELGDLFPDGYRRGACRMAGLPFFG
jgi:tRNA 2-thiouridine synthesizing protein E